MSSERDSDRNGGSVQSIVRYGCDVDGRMWDGKSPPVYINQLYNFFYHILTVINISLLNSSLPR